MLPYLRASWANAASLHGPGRAARAAIDQAREQVAALVDTHPSQIVFTAGGTEADNLAVKGLVAPRPGRRLLISTIEHPAVLESAQALVGRGWRVGWIPVDAGGRVRLDVLREQLSSGDVGLVAVMAANNETGAVQPVAEVAELARAAGALLHVDAVQMAGKLALRYADTGAHSLALSAHKLYGPKGVGALVLDKAVEFEALLHGGGHEHGLRAGTQNTAAIVGFGAAAALAAEQREQRRSQLASLRETLLAGLRSIPGITLFGGDAPCLPNTLQFALPGFEGESLLMALDKRGVAVSSGSACAAGSGEPSHVLMAMGVDASVARGAIRVSLGRDNSREEVENFLVILQELASGPSLARCNPSVLAGQ